MLIDDILENVWKAAVYYFGIAADAPTHFDYRHWVVFTSICVVLGVLCMRGFGSRKNY